MEKEVGEYFREINQAIYNKLEERLIKYELVKGQAHLLLLIRDNDGCTQKELANLVGVKYSSMSERLNKLEKSGYITRSTDEDNMKYKRIFITSPGKTAVIQCRKIIKELNEQMYKGMTKKDKVQFEGYLQKMIRNLTK